MNRETLVWAISMLMFVGGAAVLAYQSIFTERGVGNQYVVSQEITGQVDAATGEIVPLTDNVAKADGTVLRAARFEKADRSNEKAIWSFSRTAGIWVSALLTLCVFSYLYRDSVFYKLAESIIVGVSAGYWIVLSFWEVIVAKVFVKLAPDLARYAFLPDTPKGVEAEYLYLIPVVLGCLVFCRLWPKVAWLGRWPLAFVVGTTAGLKLILFLNADFIQQIRSTILPLVVFSTSETGSQLDWKHSIQNIVLVVSVISSLTYFYFSVEHKGLVGRISRMGIWVLMISFGASFALTVMGRITLLTMRFQFLFDDWLGLVKM